MLLLHYSDDTRIPYLQGHLKYHNRRNIAVKKESSNLIILAKIFAGSNFCTIYMCSKYARICTIQKFPTIRNFFGWYVILKEQGFQNSHIHTSGWLSGVIYLKVVPSLGKDEGSIEFSLNGECYHDVNSHSLTFQPGVGDMVFFPSSLHHRTIPFTTNTDRIIVSFDLVPRDAKGAKH